ncbi:MAG TPA: hypothetical protein VF952_01575 [Chloroflexia bacterium]|jgi:hypothetical protein
MSGYIDQGANTNERVTGENLEVDEQNPNIVRAVPPEQRATDETAGNTASTTRDDEYGGGNIGDIIEGSDSERTGTSWGLPGREDTEVEVGANAVQEGEGEDEAHPNRNTGDRLTRDELQNVGSWSTLDKEDSAGSPSGFS